MVRPEGRACVLRTGRPLATRTARTPHWGLRSVPRRKHSAHRPPQPAGTCTDTCMHVHNSSPSHTSTSWSYYHSFYIFKTHAPLTTGVTPGFARCTGDPPHCNAPMYTNHKPNCVQMSSTCMLHLQLAHACALKTNHTFQYASFCVR